MKIPVKTGIDMSKYPRLPEMQPLVVEIVRPGQNDKPNPEYLDDTYQGQPRKSVRFRMKVVEGPYAGNPADPENQPPGMVFAKHGATLGVRGNGEESKLRQLVQACFPRNLSDEELEQLDLDTLAGARLTVVGRYPAPKPGKEPSPYLQPVGYGRINQPQTNSAAAPTATGTATSASQGTGTDGYTYSPDRSLRWKSGMAAWEPVPQAGPPPLPAAPAPPPLPPTTASAPAAAPPPVASAAAPPAPSAPSLPQPHVAPAVGDRSLEF